ncbi:MAG: PrgI family protein [Patescibacteria group bacterium]
MASYQIPQFLDSGDKILGPLNIRQFGYGLGGFLLSALIFTIMQNLFPGVEIYAVIPCIPIVLLTAYLALGKFNGRDSEIYVLKYIIFNSKPKQMVYTRVPDMSDLDQRLSELTYDKINKKWTGELNKQKAIKNNKYLTFNQQTAEEKAGDIRKIGQTVDQSVTNTLAEVFQSEQKIKAKEELLRQLLEAKNNLKNKK